ncbi:MAG: hypothetical protein ACJ71F_20835, partial [Nitrososphaeraceae archaeon]
KMVDQMAALSFEVFLLIQVRYNRSKVILEQFAFDFCPCKKRDHPLYTQGRYLKVDSPLWFTSGHKGFCNHRY